MKVPGKTPPSDLHEIKILNLGYRLNPIATWHIYYILILAENSSWSEKTGGDSLHPQERRVAFTIYRL